VFISKLLVSKYVTAGRR